jgi:hypothetical protein
MYFVEIESDMLQYSYIDPEEPKGIPTRQVNGGLYTGESFKPNAKWGNIPIEPEAHILVSKLSSIHPGAQDMIPGTTRLGNNTQTFPNHDMYGPQYRFMCRKDNPLPAQSM